MGKRRGANDSVTDEKPAEGTEAEEESIFDKAAVRTLPDGRVEAAIRDDEDNPVDEIIGRTSQAKTAKFIFNDLCPDLLDAAKTIKPFGQK